VSFGARFVVDPEALASSARGGASASEPIALRIAGVDFVLAGLAPSHRAALEAHFDGFVSGGPAVRAVRLDVDCVEAAAFRAIDTRGWDYDLDLEPGPEGMKVAGLMLLAHVARNPLQARLWTSADAVHLPGVVENVLRLLMAYALAARGGVLLHAAGIARERDARVFFGPSGIGKSTLSGIAHAAGRAVLSDDMVALVPADSGAVEALPVPFSGDFRDDRPQAPSRLRGLWRLRQEPEHALRPLPAAGALAALIACAPYVNRDPWAVPSLLDNLEALLGRVPVAELGFAPRAGFLELCEAAS
jgi:hypothetical protein